MIPGSAPLIPSPEPLPLPAPAWLLWFLLMLTLFLHVIAMNLLLGGSLIAAYTRLRHAGNAHARMLMAQLLRPLPVLMAATVTLGVAPLLFLQVLYGRLFFVSSVLMAWWWLAVPFVLIVAYYTAYAIAHRAERSAVAPLWMHAAVAVVLLGIAFLYTTNMTLMLAADRFASLYAASGRGLHLNFADATLWPRLIHMIAGAVAVTGLAVVLAGFLPSHRETEIGRLARRIGARVSLGATVVNMAAGAWWTMMLPPATLHRFIGGNSAGTLLFVAAVVRASRPVPCSCCSMVHAHPHRSPSGRLPRCSRRSA